MKQYLLLLIYLVSGVFLNAQPLKKGDMFTLPRKLNFEYGLNKVASIGDFKGRHVILDVFESGCLACFKSMPVIQSVQDTYGDKVQFLLVGKTDTHIRGIYSKIQKKYNLKLAVAFDPDIIQTLRIESVPYCIWLKPDGTVYTVTTSSEITTSNIDRFLADEPFLSSKEVPIIPFDPKRPLYINGNGGSDSIFIMRSVLSAYIKGQRQYSPSSRSLTRNSFQAVGTSFTTLFLIATLGQSHWRPRDAFYGNVFPDPIILPSDSLSIPRGDFNYSIIVPHVDELKAAMIDDLEKAFRWTARIEKRVMPCWNLVLADRLKLHVSKDSVVTEDVSYGGINVRGYTMLNLIDVLDMYNRPGLPFIDLTGISQRLDFKIEVIMSDIEGLRRQLLLHGIDLVRGTREMKVVVMEPIKKQVAGL